MHYQINDFLIKSENAALSTKQTNKIILAHINELPKNIVVMDYGCGKCRYSKQLNAHAKKTVLLDSAVQISRTQMIHEERLSVIDYAKKHLSNAYVYSIEEYDFDKDEFDFILCSNVLSAIPLVDERKKVLRNIKKLLKSTGTALISVQYSNSYFKTYSQNTGAIKHEDGWIIKRGNSYSFYGIILPNELIELCENVGMEVVKVIKHDGSIYLTVKIKSDINT